MGVDANPHPGNGSDAIPEDRREPIYPSGPPLDVSPESVQLTFLDLSTFLPPAPEPEGEEDDDGSEPHPGLELKTPLGVRIPVFEGPLDLLLYLIRRDELDIYDIPIAHITEQYLGMLGMMQVLDLEVAGDFLVMSATLMRIKARLLLPTWPEDEEDDEDPRNELVRQLLEYRRFKEAARHLREQEERRRLWFGRGFLPDPAAEIPVELAPVSNFVLIEVMKDVLSRVGEEFFYEVELEEVSLEEKMSLISRELTDAGRVLFADLIARTPRRMHVVVAFMAILELARLGRLVLAQEATFGQIWVYPVEDGRVVTREEPEAPASETAQGPVSEDSEGPHADS